MDGHADLIGASGFPEPHCVGEAEDQGDLFTVTQKYDTLGVPQIPHSDPHGWGSTGIGTVQSGRRNHFVGAYVSDLSSAERSQYFESCLRAQENERLKLGRELHDSTGQLLLALRLEIARLREVHGASAQGSLLDEIEGTVREIDREIRAFSFTHYPAEIGREGLGPALRSLARGFANRTGLRINFTSIPDSVAHSGQVALALLRIAQEALLNVHRHAQAFHVQMGLTLRGGVLELTVRDDGVGIPLDHDLEESHGVGLLGMRHRVERLGGRFAIRRMKRGTKIVASVPA
ncbi:sensor histidine kinase [Sphingomonas sp. NSE70-1]|uniref:Oxygen sensor histidine kinase NreB n=1 Tax=Sphingomonas caseinilyticus TaxID=2908205 RepID=A0ABT0RUD7_9SPHN|nr:sensor histidine kinase [Sphingomonas caseinilyticus]MCL6698310.1 sensor histidine kinase [Sphingomonas caseinilyticus]